MFVHSFVCFLLAKPVLYLKVPFVVWSWDIKTCPFHFLHISNIISFYKYICTFYTYDFIFIFIYFLISLTLAFLGSTHLQGLLNWNHHGLRFVYTLPAVCASIFIIHTSNANILYVVLLFNSFPFHVILYPEKIYGTLSSRSWVFGFGQNGAYIHWLNPNLWRSMGKTDLFFHGNNPLHTGRGIALVWLKRKKT